jgi:hypothetical protein
MINQNLKLETLEVLKRHGKTIADIKWIGHANGIIKIDTNYFFNVAADKEYDSGFGSNEVNTNLVVVGDGWWLERWEYDGSEGWHFKEPPMLKPDHRFGKTVFVEEFNDIWSEMSNLEYLEYMNEQNKV